jgi:hypothetical protein
MRDAILTFGRKHELMGSERKVLGALVILLAVLWLGFLVHRAPRFPGSLAGSLLAISGATLMVVFSLAYMAAKRIPAVRQWASKYISTGQLLKWHVHTGAFGAVLAILHTGHRFESDLGIALTAFMLVAVLSGFVGRHLLARVAGELREKRGELSKLENAYNQIVREHAPGRADAQVLTNDEPLSQGPSVPRFFSGQEPRSAFRAVEIAAAISELEYSIRHHDRFQRLASVWLKVHIAFSLAFYILLGLHVWASIHFGLRWFD